MNIKNILRHPEQNQVLDPIETVKTVRERQLDMMDYGVIGSKKKIPTDKKENATLIPNLLYYSPTTRKHFHALREILNDPIGFHIVNAVGVTPKEGDPQGNVVYTEYEKVHAFEFPNPLTSPHLDSLRAALDSLGKPESVDVVVMADKVDGRIKVNYAYSQKDHIGGGLGRYSRFPHRRMLNQFLFSPQVLGPADFVKSHEKSSGSFAPINGIAEVACTSFVDEGNYEGFRTINFIFDAGKFADEFVENTGMWEDAERSHLHYLRNLKIVPFSIVELGKVEIGNVSYHIYSGSEQAMATEKRRAWNIVGALQPNASPAKG